jgi:hypothetical protein
VAGLTELTSLDRPLVLDDLSAAGYHARPELSSTGVRRLLAPSTPAKFRWLQDHPEPAVHALVLGVGAMPAEAPPRWQSNADKATVDEIRAANRIPLRPDDFARARAMAAAVRRHPIAAGLLAAGMPERTIVWTDPATGVGCRALIDWSPANCRSLVDLKTCRSAAPSALPNHVGDHDYHVQAAHYLEGARAAGVADDATRFVFVFVESEPPYGVTVADLHPADLEHAHDLCRHAREIFRDCSAVDVWPGYPIDLITIRLPSWKRRSIESFAEEF